MCSSDTYIFYISGGVADELSKTLSVLCVLFFYTITFMVAAYTVIVSFFGTTYFGGSLWWDVSLLDSHVLVFFSVIFVMRNCAHFDEMPLNIQILGNSSLPV